MLFRSMRSGIRGIEGVVGEMIKVPAGFETAIETALGAAMQNIVVEDDICAKKAITALKVSQSGRLTFLPVSSVHSKKTNTDGNLRDKSGFCGMGSELIGFDEKFRDVFEYLLGRVAVVKDLNAAIAMSKTVIRNVRFVTLDGEVINSGGAITGGRYKNRSANLLERKNEISALKEKMNSHDMEIANAERQLQDVLNVIDKVDFLIKSDEEKIKSGEMTT